MRKPENQRGLTLISLILILALIGLIATVVVKCLPLYLNEMKVKRSVNGIADDPEISTADAAVIRDRLQRRWDVESIDDSLLVKDVKIKRTDNGREMIYDYEARTALFYNISVVIRFTGDVPLRKAALDN